MFFFFFGIVDTQFVVWMRGGFEFASVFIYF